MPKGLPFNFTDYLELVDWTGRILREDKRGAIAVDAPPILQRLHIEPHAWLQLTTGFETTFTHFVGREQAVQLACETTHRRWAKGQRNCRRLFSPG